MKSDADRCLLRFGDQELQFPGALLEVVSFVTTMDTFFVTDIPDCIDTGSKITLVSRLVREGLLQVAEGP